MPCPSGAGGGQDNIAIGWYALQVCSFGCERNVALGYYSMKDNTSGDYNVAIGYQTLRNATDSYHNTAVGAYALYENTSGGINTALGYGALQKTQLGLETLRLECVLDANTEGSYNVAVGGLGSNTTGNYNVSVGESALALNSTASYKLRSVIKPYIQILQVNIIQLLVLKLLCCKYC